MDARRLLQRMCIRHGLAYREATRLLPLLERALVSPNEVRDRILRLIDTNLSRKANGAVDSTAEAMNVDLDEEVLMSVARVLHAWAPSAKILDLGKVLPDIFPDGFDPKDLD